MVLDILIGQPSFWLDFLNSSCANSVFLKINWWLHDFPFGKRGCRLWTLIRTEFHKILIWHGPHGNMEHLNLLLSKKLITNFCLFLCAFRWITFLCVVHVNPSRRSKYSNFYCVIPLTLMSFFMLVVFLYVFSIVVWCHCVSWFGLLMNFIT